MRLNKDGMLETIKRLQERPSKGVDTTDSLLSMVYRGLTPKTLTLFSANSNGGKTTFLIQQAVNIAINHNQPIWYISIEQDEDEIASLFISCVTGIDRNHIFTDEMTESEREIIMQKTTDLEKLFANIEISFLSDLSENFHLALGNEIKKAGYKYIFFDYISSEMSNRNTTRDDLGLKDMATKLKTLAVEYNVAVISGTQLNNNIRKSDYKIRDASWLRGSFALADKADVAMIASGEFSDFERQLIDHNPGFCGIHDTNLVIDVYKNRKGQNHLKVFRKVNFCTFETEDYAIYNENGIDMTSVFENKYSDKGE